ncbi:MAG: four helix bundle protein [Acidobacteriota bacterium]
MRPHENLDVWKISMNLVTEIYGITRAFPKEEVFGLSSQMRRSAVSIPANIAEGCARRGKKERDQFLYVARASLSELETHLEIARRLEYLKEEVHRSLAATCGRVSALIDGLLNAHPPSPLMT